MPTGVKSIARHAEKSGQSGCEMHEIVIFSRMGVFEGSQKLPKYIPKSMFGEGFEND